MASARRDIDIEQNATFAKRFFIVNKADGSPFDLTAYDLGGEAQVRESALSSVVLASFTVDIPSPATSGEVRYSMSATDTASLPVGVKEWDLFLLSSSLGRWRVLRGHATVRPTVSK
jgi:hypothetical protein